LRSLRSCQKIMPAHHAKRVNHLATGCHRRNNRH